MTIRKKYYLNIACLEGSNDRQSKQINVCVIVYTPTNPLKDVYDSIETMAIAHSFILPSLLQVSFRMRPFENLQLSFHGFTRDEETHMQDVALQNGTW